MHPSASRRTDACARTDILLLLPSDSSEARNGGSRRRIKGPNLAGAECFLDFISAKDVEALESTQRAPESDGRDVEFVT